MSVENKLEIFIVTYNRANLLRRTLQSLEKSAITKCKITVLNNSSTDNTASLYEEFQLTLPQLQFINHTVNIGANANILRAFESSSLDYTWILCDDDIIELQHFEDVVVQLQKGEVDLIQVGAHPDYELRMNGMMGKVQRAQKLQRHAYFKFSSFLPCNIFKTAIFKNQFLIEGYNSIGNSYPHFPFLKHIYEENKPVYVAEHQIVIASETGQSYPLEQWLFWWIQTSETLENKSDVRLCFLDQFGTSFFAIEFMVKIYANASISEKKRIRRFVNDNLTPTEIISFYKLMVKKSFA